MAMEAMNQAGHLKTRLIVLLNDNDMSIAPAVGSLSGYLNRIKEAQSYQHLKEEIGDTLDTVPGVGDKLRAAAKSLKDAIAAAVLPGALVNELGFKYIGYVDGHNVPIMVRALEGGQKGRRRSCHRSRPDDEGKGLSESGRELLRLSRDRSVRPQDRTAIQIEQDCTADVYTGLRRHDVRDNGGRSAIVALTAAMPDGTGVDKVLERFPDRAFDVGIAEQHAVTFCAGMACEGLKPVAAIYSTFLQRGFDQVIHDVCLQDLNVTLAMDRAGIVGADGPTHHGLLDIAYLRGYPNIALMAPKDEAELRDMMLTAIEHNGPAALRYPRGNGSGVDISAPPKLIEIGKAEIIRDGSGDVAVLAYGDMVAPAVTAGEMLRKNGIDATIVNARFVKPLDAELITNLARTKRLILTVENAYLAGGFGSAVLELLEEKGLADAVRVVRLGVPDEIVTHGDPKILLGQYGLDADGIYSKVVETLDEMDEGRVEQKRIQAVR